MRSQSTRQFLNLSLLLILASSCGPRVVTPRPGASQPPIVTAAATTAGPGPASTLFTVSETPSGPVQSPASASSGGPMGTVKTKTDCRSGPGEFYDLVQTAEPPAKIDLVGKYTPDYWVVRTEAGGECWLPGQDVTVEGDTSGLQEYAGWIVGSVVDNNGRGVGQARVGLKLVDVPEQVTNADGSFTFEHVPAAAGGRDVIIYVSLNHNQFEATRLSVYPEKLSRAEPIDASPALITPPPDSASCSQEGICLPGVTPPGIPRPGTTLSPVQP